MRFELKVSLANGLIPQSDEVATSMDPSCPSDSSACSSVMDKQAYPRLSPWGVSCPSDSSASGSVELVVSSQLSVFSMASLVTRFL